MTRRRRQIYRDRRLQKRSKKYLRHKWYQRPDEPTNSHGGGRFWVYGNQHLTAPLGLKKGSVNDTPTAYYGGTPTVPFHITSIGRAMPPHVHWEGATHALELARKYHYRWLNIGYHRRRRKYFGHKLFRMNGYDRQVMGATWFCIENNYFPLWDPLKRQPDEDAIAAGADFVDIDWRWGVTGAYPP